MILTLNSKADVLPLWESSCSFHTLVGLCHGGAWKRADWLTPFQVSWGGGNLTAQYQRVVASPSYRGFWSEGLRREGLATTL